MGGVVELGLNRIDGREDKFQDFHAELLPRAVTTAADALYSLFCNELKNNTRERERRERERGNRQI